MTGRDAAPLAERLQVLERDPVSRQVQERVEEHARVPRAGARSGRGRASPDGSGRGGGSASRARMPSAPRPWGRPDVRNSPSGRRRWRGSGSCRWTSWSMSVVASVMVRLPCGASVVSWSSSHCRRGGVAVRIHRGRPSIDLRSGLRAATIDGTCAPPAPRRRRTRALRRPTASRRVLPDRRPRRPDAGRRPVACSAAREPGPMCPGRVMLVQGGSAANTARWLGRLGAQSA